MEKWEAPTPVNSMILICPECGADNVWDNAAVLNMTVKATKMCAKCSAWFDAKTAHRKADDSEDKKNYEGQWSLEQMAGSVPEEWLDQAKERFPEFADVLDEARERHMTEKEKVTDNTEFCEQNLTIEKEGEPRYGHPRFYEIVEELAQLHSDKNHDYAAGGDPLGNFKRVASIFAMYPGLDLSDPTVVGLTYAMKQVDATLWMLSNKHTAKVEGLGGRLSDIAVYSMISMILEEEKHKDE